MKNLTISTKLVLVTGAVMGILGFLLIVEFGMSAAQVHRGVTVAGYDVGGLTLNQLEESLEERGEQLRDEPACFSGEGVSLCLDPSDLGWRPEPGATAERAYGVGRIDFPLGALRDRATAWVSGVNISWEGRPKAKRVERLLDEWEALFSARGKELQREAMRYKIRRAIVTYPRRTFRIPLD